MWQFFAQIFLQCAQRSATDVEIKYPTKLVEFTQFTESEPGHLYTEFMAKAKKIAVGKLAEFVQVCTRPIVNEEVWGKVQAKLKKEGVSLKKFIAGQFYDPLSPAAEISTFTEQIKCYEQIQGRKRAKFLEILAWVTLGLILGGVLGKRTNAGFATQIVKIYFMVIATMQIVGELVEIKTIKQFMQVELGRMRFSTTAGNLVELLKRIEEKLNYLERRSMEFFAHHADFIRMVREQITLEIWVHQDAGREKLGYLVRNFLAEKKIRGAHISETSQKQFMQLLGDQFRQDGKQQISQEAAAEVANGKFLVELADNLDNLAKEFSWFTAEVIWES